MNARELRIVDIPDAWLRPSPAFRLPFASFRHRSRREMLAVHRAFPLAWALVVCWGEGEGETDEEGMPDVRVGVVRTARPGLNF